MTDTPKPTLADVLRDGLTRFAPRAIQALYGGKHEHIWFVKHESVLDAIAPYDAERAELELRASVLRNTVEELRAEIEDHEAERAKLVAELEAFRALAKIADRNVATERVEGFDGYVAESIRSEKDAIVRELAKLAEEPKP